MVINQLHLRPCLPISSCSDMHHIPKGAPYFCIARPLHFRISHSTGFLGTNRRRIRFAHYPLTLISGKSQVLSFRETVNPSGLTWEDTTASKRQDSNLHTQQYGRTIAASMSPLHHVPIVALRSANRSFFEFTG